MLSLLVFYNSAPTLFEKENPVVISTYYDSFICLFVNRRPSKGIIECLTVVNPAKHIHFMLNNIPSTGQYMPGLQLTQSSILVRRVLLLYVPAGHGKLYGSDVPLGQT